MTLDEILTSNEVMRGIWEAECAGKVKYPSRESGEFVVQYYRRKLSSRVRNGTDDGLESYHCRFCGAWHLGH